MALVHDYLTQFGGAERVLLDLMELFPHAPVYTLLYNKGGVGVPIDESRIRTSFLQRLPGTRSHHRYFPVLMPLAVEQFDLSQYDVVLSDTHSFGKGVITGSNTMHISYCFTPTRYIWDDSHRYVREFSSSVFFQRLAPVALSYIRLWDYFAAQRVDTYLTLSQFAARRIQKYYNRDAKVVSPPVDVKQFRVAGARGEYFLIVSRLVPYKRIDLAIDACERLGVRLKVVGTGPEEAILKARAGKWTEFVGFVPDDKLASYYEGAQALLFPQEEDFGITPLEAAACGKPTVAYGAGGALETIKAGKTGLFFSEQSVAGLCGAIDKLAAIKWQPDEIRRHAEMFSREVFLRKMEETVHNHWMAFRASN